MKTNIYKYLGAFLILFGCQDLDLIPEDQLSDGSLWKNSEDYRKGVNILYKSFGQRNDNDSDIAYAGVNTTSDGSRIAPVTSGFYNSNYTNIRRCNFLLDRAKLNGFEDDRFVAEIRFFRAFYYYNLVVAYGDIPFYTEALDPSSEALFDARTSRSTVIDFLLQDLGEAAANLPLESELAAIDKGRIARGTAQALRARIALFEGTWAKYHNSGDDVNGRLDIAISAAKEIIDSDEYALYTADGADSYRNFFTESGNDSREQMFARRYDFNQQRINQVVSAPITRKMADMYLCTDGLPIDQSTNFQGRDEMTSEYENRDLRMSATSIVPGSFTASRLDQEAVGIDFPNSSEGGETFTFYRPYKFLSNVYIGATGGVVNFIHELRYAEVLLIYAEALYERNGSISDAQLDESVNLTRSRGGLAALNNAFVSTNGLDMLEEIRRERTVEFVHEGFRRSDLRRWKTAEIEMPMPILGVQFKGTEFETAILIGDDQQPILDERGNTQLLYKNAPTTDGSGNVLVDDGRSFDAARDYLEPLPTEEIVNNPNLAQNPNW